MRNLITSISLVSIVILFSACGSPFRQVKPNEVIESKYISYLVPNIDWKIDKEYNHERDKYKSGTYYLDHLIENIEFQIYTSKYMGGAYEPEFFRKDGYYYDTDIDGQKPFTENDKRTGLTYRKSWVTYVNNIKCSGGVFSRGFGGSYYSGGVKFYGIYCGYYDLQESKNDGKRFLEIHYRYTHNTQKAEEAIEREKLVKDAVKKAVSTLKLKNIDIPRMKKEGLIHDDKEFESTKW